MSREKPVRKYPRLKGHDYSQTGYYFVTICVTDRHELLGEIINGRSRLNKYGLVVKKEIEGISAIRKECIIEKFVVMPNHIHLLVQIVGDDGNRPIERQPDCVELRADYHPALRRSVSNMVQGLKGAITRQIGFPLWQRSYHDHIIRNEAEYQKIWQYIHHNPENWENDILYTKKD